MLKAKRFAFSVFSFELFFPGVTWSWLIELLLLCMWWVRVVVCEMQLKLPTIKLTFVKENAIILNSIDRRFVGVYI